MGHPDRSRSGVAGRVLRQRRLHSTPMSLFLAVSYKSPVAMRHLAEAKSRADRRIRQWSRRVLRSVAQLRRRMSGREFARAAGMSIRMESVRNSGAPESRVRPHSIRFSKVWGAGGRPSLVDARLDPVFSRGSECPLTMNQGGPNHAQDKTEHY